MARCTECGRAVIHKIECSVTRQSFEKYGTLEEYVKCLQERIRETEEQHGNILDSKIPDTHGASTG